MEPLERLIDMLEKQAEATSRAYYRYGEAKVQREHDLAVLVQSMQGKSQAEKLSLAHTTKQWLEINQVFNQAEARFDLEKRKYEVLKLEHQSVYLELKLNGEMLGRPRSD